MAQLKVYNMDGNIVGDITLPARLFDVPIVPALVHEVIVGLQANARATVAHTKTRGEVRGGGKKPWRQKGTGRARHGSIRSPIWIGGGVTGGPRPDRNFSVKINRQVRRKALAMVLSDKAAQEKIVILDALASADGKTKQLAASLKKLPLGKKTLIVLPASDALVLRASRNLPAVKTVTANALGLVDALRYDALLMPKTTVAALEGLYAK